MGFNIINLMRRRVLFAYFLLLTIILLLCFVLGSDIVLPGRYDYMDKCKDDEFCRAIALLLKSRPKPQIDLGSSAYLANQLPYACEFGKWALQESLTGRK